ncbi:MAG: TPR repeat protein [Marinobacter maritimus]|jgi:TPR repeat protein
MYFIGQDVPKNGEIAVEWYKKAAVQGDAVAYFSLGWMYYSGLGMPKIKLVNTQTSMLPQTMGISKAPSA